MTSEVMFIPDSAHNQLNAYVDGAFVGLIAKSGGEWKHTSYWGTVFTFSPTQAADITRACNNKAHLLNLTRRMLK